jgi:protein-tyrosine phosphatase
MLDFHNHLIPGVDDGAETLEQSLTGIRTMSAQGIDRIITTPHLRASLIGRRGKYNSYLDRVEKSWAALSGQALRDFPRVKLSRGFEILLDVPEVDLGEPDLRLARSAFVLVEFPFLSVPPNSARVLEEIKSQGYNPIVAHPERNVDVQRTTAIVRDWLGAGASLQVNAGSLVGSYGKAATKSAWMLLELGAVSYVSSDYHATGVCHVREAADLVASRGDPASAELLFSENPGRIPESTLPMPVSPLLNTSEGPFRWFRRWYPF